MKNEINFNSQFSIDWEDYLRAIDLSSWYRYYFIVKEVINLEPENILEIGPGNEVVKNCLKKFVKDYKTMDINSKLKPDILSDLREFKPELKEKFDCIICAEVLEHMPFDDFERNLTNIYNYLIKGGKAIITIPHRKARLMIITPISYQKPFLIDLPRWIKSSPKSFYQQVIKKRIWIDPHHCLEIGDGRIKRKDIENVFRKVGFEIEKFAKLLHVDFWILRKEFYVPCSFNNNSL